MQAGHSAGLHFFSGAEMARARNIKPSFFANEDLVELPFEARLLFIGLWTLADREGRLEDRPKRIKMAIFPADNVDVDACLEGLREGGFITRYEVDGIKIIQVVNFNKHQNPHVKEAASTLPAQYEHGASTVQAQCEHGASPADSLLLIPDSLIPESGAQRASPHSDSVATTTNKTARAETTAQSSAGEACKALRAAGVQAVNPSHPKLIALLEAGLTADELGELAREPQAAGKGFAWILAAAEGRRRDAAKIRPLPRASPSLADRNRQAAEEAKKMIFGG